MHRGKDEEKRRALLHAAQKTPAQGLRNVYSLFSLLADPRSSSIVRLCLSHARMVCLRQHMCHLYLSPRTSKAVDNQASPLRRVWRLKRRGGGGMTWRSSATTHAGLVAALQGNGLLRSEEVARAFANVDRAIFVLDKEPAYVDAPQTIGYGATISAPHIHATCAELLSRHLRPGAKVLDIGSGSGFLSAVFAEMVGPQGEVTGVEHVPELAEQSRQALREVPNSKEMLESGKLQIHQGDGLLGWPQRAPYDAIHVGAAAQHVPKPLIEQLAPGGRMIIPVAEPLAHEQDFPLSSEAGQQALQSLDKDPSTGELLVDKHVRVLYVPLTSLKTQLGLAAVQEQLRTSHVLHTGHGKWPSKGEE